MSIQNINIKGMNLHSNIADSNYGDCEELINVKSENGQLRVDTDYEVVSADIPYYDIIVHYVGTQTMYIGKDAQGVVWFDLQTGDVQNRLYESTTPEDIHLSTSGNLLIISDTNSVNTSVFAWKDNKYSLFFDGSVNFDVLVTFSQTQLDNITIRNIQESDTEVDESNIIRTVQAYLNRLERDNVHAAEGGFLMAFTLTMYDEENEIGPFQLQYIPIRCDETIFDDNGFVHQAALLSKIYTSKAYRNIQMQIYTLSDLAKYKDVIKRVNLYVSSPISRLDLTESGVTAEWVKESSGVSYFHVTVAEKTMESSNIERQLLYLNKSWDTDEFINLSDGAFIAYDIVFGGDSQTTGRTMPVTNAHLLRAGKLLTYNSRVHYYDSKVRVNIQDIPSLSSSDVTSEDGYLNANVSAYLHMRAENQNIVQRYSNSVKIKQTELGYDIYLPKYIVMPDTRAYKLTIVYDDETASWIKEISLAPSPAYDYAYAYGSKNNGAMTKGEIPQVTDNTYSEYDVINVSAQQNPVYFPANNSYRVQGNIITLALAIEPISNVQIGTFPLYVFTDRGIFVLSRGSGAVLYGNLDVINTDIIQAVTQTRTGAIYIANGNVYMLNGRQTINLSLQIDGRFDTRLRQAPAYSQCCFSDKLYDIRNLISLVPLRDYLKQSKLIYVPAREELIISNPNYLYSYVFSLMYKQWRKIQDIYTPMASNLICKSVLQNSSAAKAAQGSIIVANAVIIPEHSFDCTAHATHTGKYTSKAGEKYALIVSDVQVSASIFRYPTSLAVIMSTLTRDIDYLDDYYANDILNIYYGLEYEEGLVIRLVNLTTGGDIINVTLDELKTPVIIPDKGIGDTIKINTYDCGTITEGDSVLTITNNISNTINTNTDTLHFNANASNNVVSVAANEPGAAGNNLSLQMEHGNYFTIVVKDIAGGKDVSLEPGDYVQVIDMTRPVDVNKTIHIQTRPISFADVYATISRTVLYCRSLLSQANNLSMYIFASNNLQDWQCVSGAQKSGISIDHIRLPRVARAYKYFVIIIGGYVYSYTELGNIAIDVTPKFNKKLR